MTALIISILAGWIIFSILLGTILFVTFPRLSRINDPILDPEPAIREVSRKRKEFASLIRMIIK